jgi:hypothetical protein
LDVASGERSLNLYLDRVGTKAEDALARPIASLLFVGEPDDAWVFTVGRAADNAAVGMRKRRV